MAEIISREGNKVTISVTIELNGSMLEMEAAIQDAVNKVGNIASEEALSNFDTNGEAIKLDGTNLTSKGKVLKEYQTPYGVVKLSRHIYQSPKGGETYCPLDDMARIIVSSTPKLAQMLSHKYSSLSAKEVAEDLSINHGRKTIPSFVQETSDIVSSIAQATEEEWEYELPELDTPIGSISVSLDGTCILMREDGYREAMTGNISLYDLEGERIHTVYLGAPPEYGKAKFLSHLKEELDKIKKTYPNVTYIGLADGAVNNWEFLTPNTDYQILDFYHASEYLANASYAIKSNEIKRIEWLHNACYRLKYENNAAKELLQEMKSRAEKDEVAKRKLAAATRKKLDSAITYFTNQLSKMNYSDYILKQFPIGSGVTEAACKTLIKQRLCRSGMRWGNKGAGFIISLRALVKTTGRWLQFWNKINNIGIKNLNIA
jgi:hypothetical protein